MLSPPSGLEFGTGPHILPNFFAFTKALLLFLALAGWHWQKDPSLIDVF